MIYVGKNKKGHVIYRGPRPKTHAELRVVGIKHRFDLQTGFYELLHKDTLEWEYPHHYGITLHDYSLDDVFPPTKELLKAILEDIDNADGDVYIHCLHGKDRTGLVCAAIKMRRGWSFKNAVKDMFTHGFHKFPYLWWLIALHRLS